jgi:hypothetical protein
MTIIVHAATAQEVVPLIEDDPFSAASVEAVVNEFIPRIDKFCLEWCRGNYEDVEAGGTWYGWTFDRPDRLYIQLSDDGESCFIRSLNSYVDEARALYPKCLIEAVRAALARGELSRQRAA